VKRKTKGIIMFAFMGGIMVTSGVVIAIPGIAPSGTPETPETVPTAQAPPEQFCSSGPAQSGTYVTEYDIPSECSQPLAIAVGPDGLVWFAETATGEVARFDPASERFIEYGNPFWPENARSMMWGMDHDQDGNVWYTEDAFSSIWRFSVSDQEYIRVPYPATTENTLPQTLSVIGGDVVVNDFQGGKITFMSTELGDTEVSYRSLPSPVPNSLAGGFDIDSDNNLWYTNWIFQQDGILVKFNRDAAGDLSFVEGESASDYLELYRLPLDLSTPNGLIVDGSGSVWIADTSSSLFFRFDTESTDFTRYVTSDPPQSTFGNSSGIILTPVSRPYWMALDDLGRIVFNEQTANRIALLDPAAESIVEYLVPSKNPGWGDCSGIPDCGLAQIFGFAVSGDKVWFTEWAENKIGFVDTSVPLPFQVDVGSAAVVANQGDSVQIEMGVTPAADYAGRFAVSIGNPDTSVLSISHDGGSGGAAVTVTVEVGEQAAGDYKVLVGVQNDEIAVSQYVTVKVPPSVL
jgi:virginiamycin B lyase